jgi:hypothetical protein
MSCIAEIAMSDFYAPLSMRAKIRRGVKTLCPLLVSSFPKNPPGT